MSPLSILSLRCSAHPFIYIRRGRTKIAAGLFSRFYDICLFFVTLKPYFSDVSTCPTWYETCSVLDVCLKKQ